jgi:hypothetical protein
VAKILFIISGLTLLTMAIYWPVRQFGVIDYDDPQYLYDNPHIRQGITAAGMKDAFFNLHYENYDPPLATISFELDQNLWRLKPGPMHVENVLLHLCSGLLLWWLIWLASGEINLGFIVAAIFLCHPMHVESVAWLAERKDVLSTPLLLGAMIAYVKYCTIGNPSLIAGGGSPGLSAGAAEDRGFRPRLSKIFYALMLILFTASLFAKAMGVTLPAVLLLMDYWPLRRWPRISWIRLIVEKIPLLAISVGLSIVQTIAQRQIGAYSVGGSLSLFDRVGNAIVCYVIYLLKLLVPTDLAVFYPHPGSRPMPAVIAALGLLGLITFFCLKNRKRRPHLIVGWLWFIGTLVPVIGLVQIGAQAMADRYSYFPSIGFSIAIVWFAASLFRHQRDTGLRPVLEGLVVEGPSNSRGARMGRRPMSRGIMRRVVATSFGCAIIVVYAAIAHQQVMYWQDTESLFTHAAAVTDGNAVAYVELGNVAFTRGDLKLAADEYEKAGDDPHAMVGLGNCWLGTDPDKAIAYYRKAVAMRPSSKMYLTHLANALRQTGHIAEADEMNRRAEAIGR